MCVSEKDSERMSSVFVVVTERLVGLGEIVSSTKAGNDCARGVKLRNQYVSAGNKDMFM